MSVPTPLGYQPDTASSRTRKIGAPLAVVAVVASTIGLISTMTHLATTLSEPSLYSHLPGYHIHNLINGITTFASMLCLGMVGVGYLLRKRLAWSAAVAFVAVVSANALGWLGPV